MADSASVKVVSVMGLIFLHIGDGKCELSISQARELAELLEEAAEVADDVEDDSKAGG